MRERRSEEDVENDDSLAARVEELNEKIALDLFRGDPKIRYYHKDGEWIDALDDSSGAFDLLNLKAARAILANEVYQTHQGWKPLFPEWMKHPDRRCFAFCKTDLQFAENMRRS